MNGKIFVDSNVWIYMANSENPAKKEVALRLLNVSAFTSPQVIFECINVCRKKLKLSNDIALEFADRLSSVCSVLDENAATVYTALELCRQGAFHPFDAKIVATALHAGCKTLYSEDMHHGLVVNKTLTIINPFI